MKLKKIACGFLLFSMLACSTLTNLVVPPTATPVPTETVTLTAAPTPTATATAVALAPAYIPPECAAAPLATLPPDASITPSVEMGIHEQVSRADQLKILSEVGAIVRGVYVYPDFNGRDWKAIEARYQASIEAGLETEDFYFQMENMVAELEDEHSFFLSPLEVERSKEELKGVRSLIGIGIYHRPDPDRGRLVVISTFPGSAADYAGIKPHDSILGVDGHPVLEENYNRLTGPPCSAVVVNVQSPGGSPRDLLLVRHSMTASLRIESRLVPTGDGSRIGYIFIPTFFDETIPVQIMAALEEFGQLDGLILDLRMNGGGSSTVANPILSFFTSGRLGQFVSRDEARTLEVEGYPVNNSQTVPLVVMVSRDTISYGEIFAGILRDSRDAKIIGETSLGNVEVLHGYNFEDGSQLWIASEAFHPANSNEDWEETGIVPDLESHAAWDSFTFETDPSIAAALTLLGH